jgi:large subunit ribosomal protein L4
LKYAQRKKHNRMAIELIVYNAQGKKVGTEKVPERVFGLPANDALVYQAYTVKHANQRSNYAHTKTRAEVRGGGRKPWRQKGTGRARHGSIRSPLWVGGGVTFGPRSDSVAEKRITKKMNRKAIATVLSSKVRDKALVVVDSFAFSEAKTKNAVALLRVLKHDKASSVLVYGTVRDGDFVRAFSNIANVKPKQVSNIHIVDLLESARCVMSKDAILALLGTYGDEKKAAAPVAKKAARAKTPVKRT